MFQPNVACMLDRFFYAVSDATLGTGQVEFKGILVKQNLSLSHGNFLTDVICGITGDVCVDFVVLQQTEQWISSSLEGTGMRIGLMVATFDALGLRLTHQKTPLVHMPTQDTSGGRR
jgi:hypothetical protein